MLRKGLILSTMFLLAAALTSPALSQPLSFPLTGDQEVPPVTTDRSGSCEASLNGSHTAYDISCMHDVTDVADSAGAHIHNGAPGENGPIVFFFDATTSFSATVDSSSLSAQSDPISFEEFLDLLHGGNLYVNIHSPANPGGEIRGQIPPPPSLFFAQFGNGGGLSSEIVLLNSATTGDPITGTVRMYDADGAPINPNDVGIPSTSPDGAPFTLSPGDVQFFGTNGEGDLVQGSADVAATGPVGGVTLFTIDGVGTTGVGGASPTSNAIAPVVVQGDLNTGLAIRNVESSAILVNMSLSKNGDEVENGSAEMILGPGARSSSFVTEIFPDADFDNFGGGVRIWSDDGSFAAIALQLDFVNNIFTTLPVVPLN